MRVFIAFIISVLIYALFILLFIRYMPKLETPLPKQNNHVIKIDIRDFPLPKKEEVVKEKVVVKKQPVVKVKPKKKVVKRRVVKKKPVKKTIAQKKVIKKKIIKKRVVKKKTHKKRVVKKRVIKKRVEIAPLPIAEPIVEPIMEEVYSPPAPVVEEKSEALKKFESEMVYIAEPMITPQKSAPMPITYPNDKIRKLYGAEFHSFTPTQKQFIEENLETIQTITQRILTRRGYPEGAGETAQEGTNVVTFYLHPNGDISDLHLKTATGYRALDENTLSLIRVAYMEYPYPRTTTKITFYVTYSIYGY
jgi:TonB family protein